jgi:hypothetical protein
MPYERLLPDIHLNGREDPLTAPTVGSSRAAQRGRSLTFRNAAVRPVESGFRALRPCSRYLCCLSECLA